MIINNIGLDNVAKIIYNKSIKFIGVME